MTEADKKINKNNNTNKKINKKTNKKTGIYIHIPFCVRKCKYCAFLSAPSDARTREKYVNILIREIELRAEQFAKSQEGFDSIYFGGGTPSVLSTDQIRRILAAVRDNFEISEDAEITLEANPGTLGADEAETLGTLREFREMGINRLSMGVQSMNDERLKFLGRIHDSKTVLQDFELARKAGFNNINLDIIFSVPGETLEDALNDIRQVAKLGPEHISFYSLQLEEGTPLFEQWEAREIDEVSDEVDRATYHEGIKLLKELGYEHYEISNFAKLGGASKAEEKDKIASCDASASDKRAYHNSKYWDMSPYVGLGLGASGFLQGVRYRNISELGEYEKLVNSGVLPIEEEHVNEPSDNISEAVFLGLRRKEGIRYADIPIACASEGELKEERDASAEREVNNAASAECEGNSDASVEARGVARTSREIFWEYYKDALGEAEAFVKSGHFIIDDEGMRLTEQGIDISNKVMALFVGEH